MTIASDAAVAALVVGGAGGLGGAVARGIVAEGGAVVLADEGAWTDGVERVALDDPAMPAALVAATLARLGRLDALIVAVSALASAPLADWTPAMWTRAEAVNLRLPFLLAQAAAPALARSANASIAFVSSTATRRGAPRTHGYQATKAGLEGLMRSLAAELGPAGVRVNCVLPGWIETPLTAAYWRTLPDPDAARRAIAARIPLRRIGDVSDAAAMLLFLASPAARYVSGAAIVVDGGDAAV